MYSAMKLPSFSYQMHLPLLFKQSQCVLDLKGRIGKQSYFFNFPSFSNTSLFQRFQLRELLAASGVLFLLCNKNKNSLFSSTAASISHLSIQKGCFQDVESSRSFMLLRANQKLVWCKQHRLLTLLHGHQHIH